MSQFKPDPLEIAERKAKELADELSKEMPKDWGFVLLLMSFGNEGKSTFISNLERKGVIQALRALAENLEKGTGQL